MNAYRTFKNQIVNKFKDAWDTVKKAIIVLLEKPEVIQEYRSKLLKAWDDWKSDIKNKFSNY